MTSITQYKLSLMLSCIICFFAVSAVAEPKMLDMIVAVVEGKPLTAIDLRSHSSVQGVSLPETLSANDPQVMRALQELVIAEVVRKEAEREGISVSRDEIDRYLTEVKNQNAVDDQGFAELLKGQGLNEQIYRQQIEFEILKARLVTKNVRAKVNVLDEDVADYVKNNPARLPVKGMIELEQLFFRVSNDDERANIQLLAEAAAVSAENGTNFKEISPEHYSHLGYLKPEELRADIRSAIEGLENGQVSKPVEFDSGIIVYRLIDRRVDSELTDTLKQKIREELYQTKVRSQLDQYFNNDLPKRYDIEIKL